MEDKIQFLGYFLGMVPILFSKKKMSKNKKTNSIAESPA